jgi:hypothetical protein
VFSFSSIQDITHTQEDTIKNITSATNILLNIMCKYKKASKTNLMKLKAFSIHEIQKKITLVQYSKKDDFSWKVIECGTADIPLTFKERKKMIKVFEMFAFLYVCFYNSYCYLLISFLILLYFCKRIYLMNRKT